MKRWPVRPLPRRDETLASWLKKAAREYDLTRDQLLAAEFGLGPLSDPQLDFDPPEQLIGPLCQRSGLTRHRLERLYYRRSEVFPVEPAGTQYITDASVLLKRQWAGAHVFHDGFRPWSQKAGTKISRICLECLSKDKEPYPRLYWYLPYISTCAVHKGFLSEYHVAARRYERPENKPITGQRQDLVASMDRLTLEGLRTGKVSFNSRELQLANWLRILRVLCHELASYYAAKDWYECGIIEGVWEISEQKKPRLRSGFRVFENLDATNRRAFLKAAAAALSLFDGKLFRSDGSLASLICAPNAMQNWYEPTRYRAAIEMHLRQVRDEYFEWQIDQKLSHLRQRPPLWRALRDALCLTECASTADLRSALERICKKPFKEHPKTVRHLTARIRSGREIGEIPDAISWQRYLGARFSMETFEE